MFDLKQRVVWSCFALLWVSPYSNVFSQDDEQENDNQVPGVTVQLPTLGVSIDAQGVLGAHLFADPTGQLRRQRLLAARQSVPRALHKRSNRRTISLRKLEAAIGNRVKAGREPTQTMKALAGLTKIEYVFVVPENNDILIAGPAEPWVENLAGRFIGAESGKPTMLLEDLITAMRLFEPQKKPNQWVACSIDPTPQGIEQLKAFRSKLPRNIPQQQRNAAAAELTRQLRLSLGDSDVKVYGIDSHTHAAHVMVEADYRMKAIAIGLEIPPAPIRTFIAALKGAPKYFQRWWLTPDYKCLLQSSDGLAVQVKGNQVQLQTETINFGKNSAIQKISAKPSRAAKSYAESFTKNYAELSRQRPIFAQLRNVIDCFVLSAWMQNNKAYSTCRWTPELLLDDSKLPVADHVEIKKARSLANGLWKKNVLLLPSGGVSITPAEALRPGNLEIEKADNLKKLRISTAKGNYADWWWD